MSNYPPPSLGANTGMVNRDFMRRRGTIAFDRLIFEIVNNLSVENDEELTLEIQEQIKEWFEAKFQERDVVLAINKFIEQKDRQPALMEFCEFINNWEEKLIDENIEFRQENRGVRDEIRAANEEIRVVNNDKRSVEEENKALKEEINRIWLQLEITVLCILLLFLSYVFLKL
ncbi:uncharacterized protein LOC143075321 isoform X2 [Mytilus galloprovincialis]|uniref:uncharacterized protein LOC143075321 isoform X2 n=1 Tax=Mytilus galloprovincialis TaxID=29158 RepID=UPI003F7CD040